MADAFLRPFLAGFDAVAPRPPGGADAVAALLATRQAELVVALHRTVPQDRWTDGMRAAAERLRERTANRVGLVPVDVLRRHFG